MLIVAVMVGGALAGGASWWLVRTQRVSIWRAFTVASTGIGLAALATGRVGLSPRVPGWLAVAAGVASGAGFYAATVAFVLFVQRFPVFDRHVADIYGERRGLSLPAAIVLAAVLSAPGEELFWRGLFQWRLAAALGWVPATALTWAAFVAVYMTSRNLPIVAGAVVGGAVWGSLALWTHGVLAGILCHSLWTALMLARPPGRTARRASEAVRSARR